MFNHQPSFSHQLSLVSPYFSGFQLFQLAVVERKHRTEFLEDFFLACSPTKTPGSKHHIAGEPHSFTWPDYWEARASFLCKPCITSKPTIFGTLNHSNRYLSDGQNAKKTSGRARTAVPPHALRPADPPAPFLKLQDDEWRIMIGDIIYWDIRWIMVI